MDIIWIYGIECSAHVGVPDAERRKKQKLLIDIGLETPTAPAARADDYRLVPDYWAVEKTVRQAVESKPRRLLETVAEHAADAALKAAPFVVAVQVIAHKTPAVMPKTAEVVVSIRRLGK